MKKLLIIVLLPFSVVSQSTFVNKNYNTNQEYSAESIAYDLDSDGTHDVILNSWFFQVENNRVIEFTFLNPDNYFLVNSVSDLRISNCNQQFVYQSVSSYAFNSNTGYSNYSNETIVCPFVMNGKNGFVSVSYAGQNITVSEFYLGTQSDHPCETLGLNELEKLNGNVRYYNAFGQEVSEKKGIVIEVSENGTSRKFFE